MRLQGVLDFSLGNFLCLRGFAPMGLLHDVSEPDPSFQRDLIEEHKNEMVAFLDEGEFLFFPEVILCATLAEDEFQTEVVDSLREAVRRGENTRSGFAGFRLTCSVERSRSSGDSRGRDLFNRATLDIGSSTPLFSRIDGNHRLSATPEKTKFSDYNAPFCLILFRTPDEAKRFSRALFHNINYKQAPLTMEQNLRLILDDEDSLFSDDDLKNKPSFGWPYYLARKLREQLDPDYLPHLSRFIENEPRTFLVEQFRFLLEEGCLKPNESARREFKKAMGSVNQLFEGNALLRESKNRGLLAALIFYQLQSPQRLPMFVHWVLRNHLHLIENSTPRDLIQIFDKIAESRKKNIFVSMPFGKPKSDEHLAVIRRICDEISAQHGINPPLSPQVVNAAARGESFDINAEIIEMINGCGLLVGNLTYARPNVYHEIGFVMGKAEAMGVEPEILLFVDQTVDADDRKVHFNLSGRQYISFGEGQLESVFAAELRKRLEFIFHLKTT